MLCFTNSGLNSFSIIIFVQKVFKIHFQTSYSIQIYVVEKNGNL